MSSGPTFQVILVDADGNPITSGNPLPIGSGSGGTITLDVGDIEIGAVELKDADGTARVNVGPGVAANALRVVMASNDAVMATLATQTTLAAVLAKLSADPATQTTLAAVLAKLSSDPATQTTLAAVLAKISSDPATQTSLAALVTANHTDLAAILAKLTSDPATQTTLAAVLAKLTSDPATQTTLAALVTDTGGVTETAPATDTASSGLNGRLQRVAQRLTSLIALLPTALGAGGGLKVDGSGTSLPVTASAGTNLNTSALALETGGNLATMVTDLGGVTETAPATDTASSGLNGRLQRIAQRLTSVIALLPTALTGSGALKVGQPDSRTIDTVLNSATLNLAITINLDNAEGVVGFNFSGLTASGATFTFEACNNIGASVPVWAGINSVTGSTLSSTITTDGNYRVEAGGRTGVRARVSIAGTGNVTISASASSASSLTTLGAMLPAGTNLIGTVAQAQTATDGSTTITSGGSAQNLFSGTTPTNGWSIGNPDAGEDLWVSDTTTAAPNGTGSIRVAANGGVYETPVGRKPLGPVSVYGATTAHKLTASRW